MVTHMRGVELWIEVIMMQNGEKCLDSEAEPTEFDDCLDMRWKKTGTQG